MSLRIAFDLDGVLADLSSALAYHADGLFGPGTLDDETGDTDLNLAARQQRRLWNHVQAIENFWETLEEIEPGAIAEIGAQSVERRWNVVFLTKRLETAGLPALLQTERWLEGKGFRQPNVFAVRQSTGTVADLLSLDAVVDDRPENCLDVVVDSAAVPILMARYDASLQGAATRLGISMVPSIRECLRLLTTIERRATPTAGSV